MQAYDLVKLRSTASCRIVGIAAASEGGAVAGVIGTRQSRMIGESDLFLSADFLTPFASSRKDRRSPTTGPAGQHRRQVTRTPPRAWVRAPTTTAIAMWSSPAGPERSAPRWWARCSRAGAARARRCEIAGIKADGSAQDWASLYQQRIGQQTSTSHGAVPARSSATGLADGRAKPSPP